MEHRNRLTIRPYQEDADAAIASYELPEGQAIYTSLPAEVIREYRDDSHNQPFLIYAGDQLAGCFALYTDPSGNRYTKHPHAIVFKSFSIDARHQKKGYALETLQSLHGITAKHVPGADEIILTVHHTNTPAIHLYRKAGFEDRGLRYDGEHGEELIFHLNVKRG